MKSFGYHILYGNVILDNYGPVEDWYVNQELYSKYKDLELHNANCKEIINAIFRKN
jgi:hypothetical protein